MTKCVLSVTLGHTHGLNARISIILIRCNRNVDLTRASILAGVLPFLAISTAVLLPFLAISTAVLLPFLALSTADMLPFLALSPDDLTLFFTTPTGDLLPFLALSPDDLTLFFVMFLVVCVFLLSLLVT
ncbi:hypothetical protein J6590_076135 [Homalodisca vitripennis]|nr:hypothetical protein J6590_076135 [Homalodisca vitripennis]